MKMKIISMILVVILVIVIFSFSLQTGSDSSNVSNGTLDFILNLFNVDIESLKKNNYNQYYLMGSILRKSAHFFEYFILGIFCYITFRKINCSLIFCVCIASIDEIIQKFIPNRVGTITDVLIDAVGALCGIILIYLILKKKRGEYND